MQVSRKVSRT